MSNTKQIAIVGASGYTGQELTGLVQKHPNMHLHALMTARKHVVPDAPALPVDPQIQPLDFATVGECDAVFLCTPHGAAAELTVECLDLGCKVVDLSADFRLKDREVYATTYGLQHSAPDLLSEAVYGLTEHQRAAVASARLVANPGCYPTSILLPLLPLSKQNLLEESATIFADSKSGVSGAGKTPKDRTIYGAIYENFLAYGVGNHRHTPEIHQELGHGNLIFVPHLLPMFRGMLSTIYVTPTAEHNADSLRSCLADYYAKEPFVQVFEHGQPETNRVSGTNQCHISVTQAEDKVVLTSVIDNLGKGAAGQAVQNMNLILGLPETQGLI